MGRASALGEKHGGDAIEGLKDSLREAKRIMETRLSEQTVRVLLDMLWDHRLDAANFIGPIEIKWSPGKGRGLFLTRDVRAGELLLVEDAI